MKSYNITLDCEKWLYFQALALSYMTGWLYSIFPSIGFQISLQRWGIMVLKMTLTKQIFKKWLLRWHVLLKRTVLGKSIQYSLKKRRLTGILPMYTNNWKDSANRIKALPSGDQWQDQIQWAQTEILDSPPENQETCFHHGGDWELSQTAQECCGVSVLGVILKPLEHGPEKTTLDVPAWTGRLDQTTSEGYCNLHHSVILW